MTRFASPEAVRLWAETAALEDVGRLGVDPNPYSTPGRRDDWNRGFLGLGPRPYGPGVEYDTAYQRGAAAARLLQSVHVRNNDATQDS